MKTIRCIRGGQPFPFILSNGDKYDSIMSVYQGLGNDRIFTAYHVNTDPSFNDKHFGILAEGNYRYICGRRDKPGNPKVLYLYQTSKERDALILKSTDLLEEDRVLPSLIPNPHHDNEYIISQILVHCGGHHSDLSEGCITIDPSLCDAFNSYFAIDEKGDFILSRSPTFVPDERYRV